MQRHVGQPVVAVAPIHGQSMRYEEHPGPPVVTRSSCFSGHRFRVVEGLSSIGAYQDHSVDGYRSGRVAPITVRYVERVASPSCRASVEYCHVTFGGYRYTPYLRVNRCIKEIGWCSGWGDMDTMG